VILEGYKPILVKISKLHLDKGVLAELKTQLTQKELEIASSQIQGYYTKNKLMDKDLLASFTRDIKSSKNSPTLVKASLVASKILKRIESINIDKANISFINLKKKIDIIVSTEDEEKMKKLLDDAKTVRSSQSDAGEGGPPDTKLPAPPAPPAGAAEEKEETGAAEEKAEAPASLDSLTDKEASYALKY